MDCNYLVHSVLKKHPHYSLKKIINQILLLLLIANVTSYHTSKIISQQLTFYQSKINSVSSNMHDFNVQKHHGWDSTPEHVYINLNV